MITQIDRRLDHHERYSHLTSADLLRDEIKTERLEVIKVGQIIQEHALIDDDHADELGDSMEDKRGQITPITVRARIAERRGIVYDVIDGFHRTEGKRRKGHDQIDAKVLYGCDDEEMYDQRILAASSVKSVQFARIAQWITNSYSTTPWHKKGISVGQAFNIAHQDSMSTTLSEDVSRDEVVELKDWLRAKCKRWGRPLGSVRIEIQLVANSDPALVEQVRSAGGGHEAETTLSQLKLGTVVRVFPGEENYAVQRAIIGFSLENRVRVQEMEAIAELMRTRVQPGMTEEELVDLARQANAELPKFEPAPKGPKRSRRYKIARPEEAAVLAVDSGKNSTNGFEADEPDPDEMLKIEQALSSGKLPDDLPKNPGSALAASLIEDEEEISQKDNPDLSALRAHIKELETRLDIALAGSVETPADTDWWKDAPYLTPIERFCIARGFYGNEDLDRIAIYLRLPLPKVFGHMRNAFAKRDFEKSKESTKTLS